MVRFAVRVDSEFGKVEVVLPKDVPDVQWASLGSDLDHHNVLVKTADRGSYSAWVGLYFTTSKEGNVLFNYTLNTFHLQLYGVRHMVKDHSDSERKPTSATTWATRYD